MAEPFIGIQIAAETILDEGIERCLDGLQEMAGINALIIYSHNTYARPFHTLADHSLSRAGRGGPHPRGYEGRTFPSVWVNTHDEFYGGTALRWPAPPTGATYAGADIFDALAEPAAKRGMQLWARNLGFEWRVPNGPKVLEIDCYGRQRNYACYNHPDYANFCVSTVEDLFKTHPQVAGLKYGPERTGPMGDLIYWSRPRRDMRPYCFCEHCRAKGRARGIDVVRARTGMAKLYEFVRSLVENRATYTDGAFVTYLRLLLQYPEILAWEQFWYDSKEDVAKALYGTIKAIRPDGRFGLHIHHSPTLWDVVERAQMNYNEMAEYADWIKPIVYHDICGRRLRHWAIECSHASIFSDIPEELLMKFTYAVMQFDPAKEPGFAELGHSSFSSDWVYREVKRCVDGVAGKCEVYGGVGFDVPMHWSDGTAERVSSDPEGVYQATWACFEAGATGLVVSREYNEMAFDNLRAVGRAVRER